MNGTTSPWIAVVVGAFAAIGVGCVCPTLKCETPPTITFDVRGSADAGLTTATISGGAAKATLVAVPADGCFSPPCTHQYFEPDARGARSFQVSAEGFDPTTVEVVLKRTEDGCSVEPQRARVILVARGSSAAATKSLEALPAGCAQ